MAAIGLALAVLVAVMWIRVLIERPRLDRNWIEHLAIMPEIDLSADHFALSPATDWSYDAKGPIEKRYASFAADIPEVRNVWFMVEPHPGMKPMAHTLVMFEFPGDRMIGLTIEARREANEEYSALWGAFNKFELAYIWSTPKDLLTRRAVYLDHDVLVYPLQLSEQQKKDFLRALLEQTQKVSTTPRFYNTLVSNCTNELAKTAALDWHYAFILTGYSAERLYDLKMISGKSFEDAQARALVTDKVKSWNSLPSADFDRALLAELRTRNAMQAEAAMAAPMSSAP